MGEGLRRRVPHPRRSKSPFGEKAARSIFRTLDPFEARLFESWNSINVKLHEDKPTSQDVICSNNRIAGGKTDYPRLRRKGLITFEDLAEKNGNWMSAVALPLTPLERLEWDQAVALGRQEEVWKRRSGKSLKKDGSYTCITASTVMPHLL